MKHAPVLLALTTCLLGTSGIARSQAPPESLRACARMSDPGERLRCYDTQMAAMGIAIASPPPAATGTGPTVAAVPAPMPAPAPAPAPSVAPPPPAVVAATPPAPTPEEKFGAENLKQAERPKTPATDKVMLATITSIKEVRPKVWVIGLSNGQIWLQEGTQITSFFKVGFDARIEKGLFSDYRMATAQTGEGNMVRVSRIQ